MPRRRSGERNAGVRSAGKPKPCSCPDLQLARDADRPRLGGEQHILEEIKVVLGDGRPLAFEVETAGAAPACFAMGVRKSGSSIFSNLSAALAMRAERPVIDVAGTVFQKGGIYPDWNRAEVLAPLVRPGNMYIGFRDAPTALFGTQAFADARRVLLVRDPRDALVSEYFSIAYSHSLPKERAEGSIVAVEREKALKSSLESYVVGRVAPLNATIDRYAPLLDDPDTVVLRYEDWILEKAAWIRRLAGIYEVEVTDHWIGLVLGWADKRPEVEDPTAFVRRVVPGDHREKLSPETIAAVEAQLSDTWARLGY